MVILTRVNVSLCWFSSILTQPAEDGKRVVAVVGDVGAVAVIAFVGSVVVFVPLLAASLEKGDIHFKRNYV